MLGSNKNTLIINPAWFRITIANDYIKLSWKNISNSFYIVINTLNNYTGIAGWVGPLGPGANGGQPGLTPSVNKKLNTRYTTSQTNLPTQAVSRQTNVQTNLPQAEGRTANI